MNFAEESYVRVYTRDTGTWNRMGWEGQTVLLHLLRRVDRAGTYNLAGWDPVEALAHACRGPKDFISDGLAILVELKVVVCTAECIFLPRFKEAQTSKKTNLQRQRDFKATQRAKGQWTPEADQTSMAYDSNPDEGNATLPTNVHEGNAALEVTRNESLKAKQSKVEDLNSSSLSAEQPACQVVELRHDRRKLAVAGYRWLDDTLGGSGRAPDLIAWQAYYESIGTKPPAERALVARHLMLTPYIQECVRKAKPDHVLRYWDDFLAGPRMGFQPKKATSDEQYDPNAPHPYKRLGVVHDAAGGTR